MRTTIIEAPRYRAQRQMTIEDGATAEGEQPPVDHLKALNAAGGVDQIEQIRAAHAEGRGPPEWAGNPGNSGNAGNGGGGN